MTTPLDARIRLSSAARLRFDARTNGFILLSPERGLRLNHSAAEVLARCTGTLSVRQIAEQLFDQQKLARSESDVDPLVLERVTRDVAEFVTELRRRGLLTFEQVS